MITIFRYITLILTLSALLTLYFTLLVTVPVGQVNSGNYITNKSSVTEVVAYSLRKQIEIESEQVSCEKVEDEGNFVYGRGEFWTEVPETNLFVFNVYFDDRLEPFRYLRILGMIKGTWNRTLYCQTVSETNIYHITKAVRTEIWLKQWHVGDEDTFNPVLLSCYIPKNNNKPKQLSLNTKPCQLSKTRFKFVRSSKTKVYSTKQILMTVCVKPLNFIKDISKHLIEWIEMNKILGANKFEIFIHKVPEKVLRILKFYRYKHKGNFSYRFYRNVEEYFRKKSMGNELLTRKRIPRHGDSIITRQMSEVNNENVMQEENNTENVTLQFDARHNGSVKNNKQNYNHARVKLEDIRVRREVSVTVNNTEELERKIWQKRRNELMAYNDCLYRNLHSSHFVIPIDIDEIIVPKRFYTWEETLRHIFASAPHLQDEYASFSAQNTYFLEELATVQDAQDSAFFFKYIKRTEFSEEGESGKSFVSSKNALTVFNHYALDSLKPGIRKTYFLPQELVQMNHYKRTCSVNLLPQCAKYLSSPVRIIDRIIYKYKKEFSENYGNITSELLIFNKRRKPTNSVLNNFGNF